MKNKKIKKFLLLVVCVVGTLLSHAQNNKNKVEADSIVVVPKDTTKKDIYTTIYKATEKRKWTKTLHDAIFSYQEISENEINNNKAAEDEYMPYSGKPIRSIKIIRLSPFGTNINYPDSLHNDNFLNNGLNALHKNTRKFVIQANLLFNKGEAVDPYKIAESEAYLRELNFTNDARIRLSQATESDSIDVTVILRDRFSIGFDIRNISFNRFDLELFDRNFIGLGSELSLRFMHNRKTESPIGYGVSYNSPNIFRTFFRFEASYLKDYESETMKFQAERQIQINLKYIGGISYIQRKEPIKIYLPNDTIMPIRLETFSATFGRLFNLDNNNGGNKLAVMGRYIMQNNLSKLVSNNEYPFLNYSFEKKNLLISSFSLFNQRFYRSSMIHNFGTTEDIAYGYNATAQVGYENHTYFNRMYGSFSLAGGKNTKVGYFYSKASYGTYLRNGNNEQGVLRLYSSYHTPLIKMGRSYFRQFASADLTLGINRLKSADEFVFFSYLTNFNTSKYNNEAKGIRRLILNTESDWFSPMRIIGFQAVLFSFINYGWLGGMDEKLLQRKNFFSGYGIGIRTRNNQLVFKTIEFKLAYYPQLNQSKFYNFYNFTTSTPKVSPNFKPDYPNIIPFE